MTKRILLLDDDAAVRRMLVRLLDEENYVVRTVLNGREALNAAAAEEFDLLLIDINLAGEDGNAFCEQFTRLHPKVPAVIMSARSGPGAPAKEGGIGVTLEKPLDLWRLLRVIDELMPGDGINHGTPTDNRTAGRSS